MALDPLLPQWRIDEARAGGFWPDRILVQDLDEAAAALPDQVAVTDINSMTGQRTTLSYRQLRRLVDRIALGLVELGVEHDDIVSFQLPNWWEFVALHLACVRIGAVTNPLMPIFRERELGFMLGLAESKVMVVPREFRGHDYPAMMAGLRAALPKLEHVLVIGGKGETSFEERLLKPRREEAPDAAAIFARRRPQPNDVTQLLYTSGTTGEPKGAMHSSNTLQGNIKAYVRFLGLNSQDVILMASPMAHQTGFMYGMVTSLMLRAKLVLQDVWTATEAAERIADEGVTFTMASTPFLADLTDTPALAQHDISSLRIFLSAGAPIPPSLVSRAHERLGARIVSAWGMTENGIQTATRPDDPPDRACETDGIAMPGLGVRVVDDEKKPCPPGTEGNLETRGFCNFLGYLKRPHLSGTDAEGWFTTGDIARMDEKGYIRISGRSKDIIIRGGENVPVVEIESLLYRHPSVQDAALVAMPDERLGERGCAFVVVRPGQKLSFAELVKFCEAAKMARQYWPERLEIIEAMPRTPTGKIQKFRLRELAKRLAPEA